MLVVSDAFKSFLSKSHTAVIKTQIARGSDILWDGSIADGSTAQDPDAKLYRAADITINLDKDDMKALIPALNTDALAPFGTEIRMWRGIKYPDPTMGTELVPLGKVVIEKTRTIDSGQGLQLKLTGKDLGYKVGKNKFTSIYTIAGGTWYGQALKDIFVRWAPWVTWQSNAWSIVPGGYTSAGAEFDSGSDVWEAAYKIASDAGYRLYFNEYGNLDLAPIPASAILNTPVWNLVEGGGGNLLYVDKEFTVEDTYNKVVVVGNPSNAAPVTATATDNDPSSPTYINGPFGIVPMFYTSPFIQTVAQAQAVANNMLWRRLGGQENMHIQALVAPMVEPDDIVFVKRDVSRVSSNYRINKVTIPLTNDRAMDITMSTRRIPT
jgi:hypothetical protein